MKPYLIIAAVATLCFSCERKETTINPPATNDTTIVTPATSTEKKVETEKTVMPDGGATIEKKETTTEVK